jgi:hypothetical protein
MAVYSKNSVYYGTPINNGYLGFYNPRLIPNHIDDRSYVVDNQYAFRPDLLAYDLYGTTQLWWIFAQRNPNTIKDPIYDLQPGVTIEIPSKEYLELLLKS